MPTRSKFTAETRQIILEALRAGNTVENALRQARVHRSQHYRWMARGETARVGSAFRQYREDVEAAQGDADATDVEEISRAGLDDWRARAWLLERRRPREWNKRQEVQVEVGPIALELKWPTGGAVGIPSEKEPA